MNDDFELAPSSPLTQEDWDRLMDVEMDRTRSVHFLTPSGKKKEYVSLEALREIRDEIKEEHDFGYPSDCEDVRYGLRRALEIIDHKMKDYGHRQEEGSREHEGG